MNYFEQSFKDNLKKAIQRLYDRDKRIGLFPKEFWIVEKNLSHLKAEGLIKIISKTLLSNAP